jgi:acyl dehydratase
LSFHPERVGWTRDSEEFRVNTHRLAQFARALDDDNPAHLAGRVASPVFAHVPVMQSLVEIIGLVTDASPLHGEHDFHFVRTIEPGQRLFSQSTLQAVRQSRAGVLLIVRSETRTHAGHPVTVQYSTCLVPQTSLDPEIGDGPPERPQLAGGTPAGRLECALPVEVARRYADAARDYSPYTLLPEAALRMGFPAPILHGMCTIGYAGRCVVDQGAGGEVRRLKRLGGRFSHPVFIVAGQRLTTQLYAVERNGARLRMRFETQDRDGRTVIKNGFAEIES